MKIYTKTGDRGDTGLFGGARVSKASARVAAYGEIDELNSVLGVALTNDVPDDLRSWLTTLQSELFDLGAELASNPAKDVDTGVPLLGDDEITRMEGTIDLAERELEPLKTFVMPGGTRLAADLHVARTVCRRAERSIVALAAQETVRPEVVRYVNRLSDLLFTLARLANARAKHADVPWLGRAARRTP